MTQEQQSTELLSWRRASIDIGAIAPAAAF